MYRGLFVIALAFVITAIFSNCKECCKANQELSNRDTISLFELAINFPEFTNYVSFAKVDTIYIIKNGVLNREFDLNIKNKKVLFIKKPDGYPKYGEFDFNKYQISMEQVYIKDNKARCLILIKNIGVVGEFKFIKNLNVWTVESYNKIMI